MRVLAGAILVLLVFCAPTRAEMFGELRGGAFASVATDDGSLFSATRIENANVEFLFKPLLDAAVFGSLNPHIGLTASFGAAPSYGYAGLSWHLPIVLTPVFVEAGLGAALSSDAFKPAGPDSPNTFGCAVLGHAEGSIGVSLIGLADVMLTAEHYFPMGGCDATPATTNVGARLGVSF